MHNLLMAGWDLFIFYATQVFSRSNIPGINLVHVLLIVNYCFIQEGNNLFIEFYYK